MSTFFLQRGIRLPVSRPGILNISDIILAPVRPPSRNGSVAVERKVEQFLAEEGTHVVVRLGDVDPYCQAQRAETMLLLESPEQVRESLALLQARTGLNKGNAKLVVAAHRRQDIGHFQSFGARILRGHHAHYPMMSTACIARKILRTPPLLMRDLHVKGILVMSVAELLSLSSPRRLSVVSVILPDRVINVRLQYGVTVQQVLDAVNVDFPFRTVVMGTPLRGRVCEDLNVPVAGDALTLLAEEAVCNENMPCCNCGKCVKVCPAGLLPGLLSKHIYAGHSDEARSLNVHSCIECGACAWICPSGRPLVAYMKLGKEGADGKR